MPAPMRPWLCIPLSAFSICLGCSTARLADSSDSSPTLVRLSPDVFLGEVACSPGEPGALQAYSVRLFQVGSELDAGAPGESLAATSPAVSCVSAVSFQALDERRYVADIVAFDQAPGDDVVPRWRASCGRGPDGTGPALIDVGSNELGATKARLNTIVPIVGCTYLSEAVPGESETSVIVSLADALGALECGRGAGQVSDFEAVLDGQRRTASCTGQVRFDDVPLDTDLVIDVRAFASDGLLAPDAGSTDAGAAPEVPPALDAGADAGTPDAAVVDAAAPPVTPGDASTPGRVPQWTTQCTARASAGVVTRAQCDPLQPVVD
jgi:hypothetical protein